MDDKWEILFLQEEKIRRDHVIRERVFGHYGQVCVCCGAMKGLTIDHVNGDGKAHREELSGDLYTWLIRNGFPPGFQVLCIPCNSSKGTGPVCRMHDETRNLKKLWQAMPREQRISFLAWVPELDPERPESIWKQTEASKAERKKAMERTVSALRGGWPRDEGELAEADQLTQNPVDLVSEYSDFRVLADQIGYPDGTAIHPARRRMHEFLVKAGTRGLRVGDLGSLLAAEDLGVHRNTLHEWLRTSEALGWVQRKGRVKNDPYARWVWVKPLEDPGPADGQ